MTTDFTTGSLTAQMAQDIFSQTPNILTGGGYLAVITLGTTESVDAAITRTKDSIPYFGILSNKVETDASTLAIASVVQSLNKIDFMAKKTSADLTPTTGIAAQIANAGYDKTRILTYIDDNSTDTASVRFAAAYAGRALSTNFSGSNTTQTMHLKDIKGIDADAGITQTLLNNAKTVGSDVYPSFGGVPKVFSTSGNEFFDRVYNKAWLITALETAGFNYLAQTNSKIPQSESGISGLKGAYRRVLEQAIANGYIGAGSWTSADTFGNLEDFHRNIEERGYYIYSLPVSQQSNADRTARQAPLIRIAIKELGSVHSSNVIVNINA